MAEKKIITYIVPQSLENGITTLGQVYEINIENGIKVLNSKNANYSFGSLHQIMLKGISEVLKKHRPERILMLGLGAGSALSILYKKCKWPYSVTAIEIDHDLVQVAETHFGLGEYQNLRIIKADAENEIRNLKEKFDLIIDDIFWDNVVPGFCLATEYLLNCSKLLNPGGIYMRNIMGLEKFVSAEYEQNLLTVFASINMTRHTDFGNNIYFCSI